MKVHCFWQFQSQMLTLKNENQIKIFPSFTIGLVKQLMLRIFFTNSFVDMSKEKYQKLDY